MGEGSYSIASIGKSRAGYSCKGRGDRNPVELKAMLEVYNFILWQQDQWSSSGKVTTSKALCEKTFNILWLKLSGLEQEKVRVIRKLARVAKKQNRESTKELIPAQGQEDEPNMMLTQQRSSLFKTYSE